MLPLKGKRKNFGMLYRFTLQIVSFIFLCSSVALGQDPLQHNPTIFVDSLGQVWAKADSPAYFFIEPADSSGERILIPSTDKAANPMTWDGEGSHYLVQRNSQGTPSVRFRILTDGTPPKSEVRFLSGLVFPLDNTFFAETNAPFVIEATDIMSGVNKSFYSLSKSPFEPFDQPIRIDQEGEFDLMVYSVDNVGNVEKAKRYTIITTADAVVRMDNIYFDLNSTNLSSRSISDLNKLANILKQFPDIHLEIRAHTDSRGNPKYNLSLSEQRAQSAVNYLISRGVPKNRLSAKGYGDTMLLNECDRGVVCSEEKHRENRRVEFMIRKIVNE